MIKHNDTVTVREEGEMEKEMCPARKNKERVKKKPFVHNGQLMHSVPGVGEVLKA